jgi:hypothetical protein
MATNRKSSVGTRQPTMLSERTVSYVLPGASDLQRAKTELDVLSRQSTQRKSSVASPSILPRAQVTRSPTSPSSVPGVFRMASLRTPTLIPVRRHTTVGDIERQPTLPSEAGLIRCMSSRKPTLASARRSTIPKEPERGQSSLEPQVTRKMSSRVPTLDPLRKPTTAGVIDRTPTSAPKPEEIDQTGEEALNTFVEPEEQIDLQSPVERFRSPITASGSPALEMNRTMTQPTRRRTVRSPSPIPEQLIAETTISRVATRQPTRSAAVLDSEAEIKPSAVKAARTLSRRQSVKSPSPSPEEAFKGTVAQPALSRIPTRKRTQTIKASEVETDAGAPVMGLASSITQESAAPDEEAESFTATRIVTRQPTRRAYQRIQTQYGSQEEVSVPPVTIPRRASTRRGSQAEAFVLPITIPRRASTQGLQPSKRATELVQGQLQPNNGAEDPTVRRASTHRVEESIGGQPGPEEGMFGPLTVPVSRTTTQPEPVQKTLSKRLFLLDEPLAVYDVYNGQSTPESEKVLEEEVLALSSLSRRGTTPTLVKQQNLATGMDEAAQQLERQSTMPRNGLLIERPRSVDKAPTVNLPRTSEPQEPSGEPLPIDRRQIRFDPDDDRRLSRVLTAPASGPERPRRVSAAPGIMAPPELLPKGMKPTLKEKRPRKYVVNYPPESQHPQAPAYPSRETPSWTRPDTQTPPPKHKEAESKMRGAFSRGTKPKKKPRPVMRSRPAPPREVEPFQHAAPGRAAPGGTQKRPRAYDVPIPPRYYDYPARRADVYARKDDYYPRLVPVRQESDYYRPGLTRIRRDYPSPAPPEYRDPYYYPPQRDYW